MIFWVMIYRALVKNVLYRVIIDMITFFVLVKPVFFSSLKTQHVLHYQSIASFPRNILYIPYIPSHSFYFDHWSVYRPLVIKIRRYIV